MHENGVAGECGDRAGGQVVTQPEMEQREHTARLRAIADGIRRRMRQATDDVIAIGNDLLAAKATLDHGQFEAWLTAEFEWSLRTARRFMTVAEFVKGKSAKLSDLPPAVLYTMSAPSVPNEIVNEVTADLDAGRRIHHAVIRKRINETRASNRKTPAKQESQRIVAQKEQDCELERLTTLWRGSSERVRVAFIQYVQTHARSVLIKIAQTADRTQSGDHALRPSQPRSKLAAPGALKKNGDPRGTLSNQ